MIKRSRTHSAHKNGNVIRAHRPNDSISDEEFSIKGDPPECAIVDNEGNFLVDKKGYYLVETDPSENSYADSDGNYLRDMDGYYITTND